MGKKSGRLVSLINVLKIKIHNQRPKKTIQRHYNQIRKRYAEDISNQKEEPMKVTYDLFDVPIPLVAS